MIDGCFSPKSGEGELLAKSSMIYAFQLGQICWLLNDCFHPTKLAELLHYFALLMYFLTSHVHNSVSCEISMGRWRESFHWIWIKFEIKVFTAPLGFT